LKKFKRCVLVDSIPILFLPSVAFSNGKDPFVIKF
jgi:hypothetical protein